MQAKNNARVLVVDERPELRELEIMVLRDAGYDVVSTSSLADALDAAEREKPNVVVVDAEPRQSIGWDLMDRLLQNPETRQIPVVVISTLERVVGEAQAAPNVRTSVIAPYDIDALSRAVAMALGNPPPAAVVPPAAERVPASYVTAADILTRGSRRIVLRTVNALRREEPFASRFPELSRGLVDDLGMIFGAIVEGLRRTLPPTEVFQVPKIRQSIDAHDRLRHRQGVPLTAAIREAQILRDEATTYLRGAVDYGNISDADAIAASDMLSSYFAALIRLIASSYAPTRPSSPPTA